MPGFCGAELLEGVFEAETVACSEVAGSTAALGELEHPVSKLKIRNKEIGRRYLKAPIDNELPFFAEHFSVRNKRNVCSILSLLRLYR